MMPVKRSLGTVVMRIGHEGQNLWVGLIPLMGANPSISLLGTLVL